MKSYWIINKDSVSYGICPSNPVPNGDPSLELFTNKSEWEMRVFTLTGNLPEINE